MLSVSWDTVRLFLHVLAATVWVGGQIVLAALVPVLRRFGAEVPRAAAGKFNQVAWIAFAVLIITGVWNIVAVRIEIPYNDCDHFIITGSFDGTKRWRGRVGTTLFTVLVYSSEHPDRGRTRGLETILPFPWLYSCRHYLNC